MPRSKAEKKVDKIYGPKNKGRTKNSKAPKPRKGGIAGAISAAKRRKKLLDDL